MLNTLVSLSAPKDSVPVVDLVEVLQSDHDISRDVMLQIMAWFGELGDAPNFISQKTTWKMDVHAIARQIGLGILSRYRVGQFCLHGFHYSLIKYAGDLDNDS